MTDTRRLAGVELGGTKVIAVLARGREIVEQVSWPTREPAETLPGIAAQLQEWHRAEPLAALGIASFGPLGLDPAAPDFGHILATPKPGWSHAPVAQALTADIDCPWRIDTDVNAAALAEHLWGAGRNCSSLCYVTIGTGVGGGLVIDGRPVHGAMHPEIGHLRLRRAAGDIFPGVCPFHGDCIEGLISGPALAARFGEDPARVGEDDPRWAAVASDLAELAAAILLTASPQCILIGGGVGIGRAFLLEQAQNILVERMAGYLPFLEPHAVRPILRPPALAELAGPMGALALAS